jgi:hypothetical protein
MARQARRLAVIDVERGQPVLELVDTALDALRLTDDQSGPVFRCGPTTVRIDTPGGDERPTPLSHLPSAGVGARDDHDVLVVHRRAGELPGTGGRRPPAGFHRVRDARLFVTLTDQPPTLSALRLSDHRALTWIDDAAHEPAYVRFRPLAEIFAAWLPVRGGLLLHAAAVGDAAGALLLVGDGGSGKSTTALLCHQAGLGFLADDFCVLEPGPPPRVHSIYRSAKLRHDSAGRVPPLDLEVADVVDGDHYFLVDEARTVVTAPVRGIIATRPAADGRAQPRLVPVADADDAFRLLLPTVLKAPSGGPLAYRHWMRAVHGLARGVPTSVLELTWDADRVVELVREALHADRTVPT